MHNIEDLIKYNDETTIDGIMMPTKEEFDNKVLLTIQLWPQINDDNTIAYLFGKGVGVELALQGSVLGREKNDVHYDVRTHSDLDIYDSFYTDYNKIEESINFRRVFKSQELYPKTKTKGLKNLPFDLMDNTYETVIYNDNKYLIPNLELLFLDKYLRREGTPRTEGYDYLLLLKQYKLDLDLIIDYFHQYVKIPELSIFSTTITDAYNKQINGFNTKFINYILLQLEEYELDLNLDNINNLSNKLIADNISKCYDSFYGINLNYCPNSIKYIKNNNDFVIDNETTKNISTLINNYTVDKKNSYDKIENELIELYNNCYKNNKKM